MKEKQRFGIVLPIALLAYFLILMDNSIIFTSSVQIGESLNLSASSLAWVSNAYTLTFGGFLLLSGRLSDLLGRKRIFQIGLTIFGLSSLVIGLSQSEAMIIIARGVQGIGSSIIASTSLALIMDAYQDEQRARAISYYGVTAGIGSSVGLLIGGALTSFISWRAGFLINVPLSLTLFLMTQRGIAKTAGRAAKIDYVGSLLSVVGLASLIYGLDGRYYQAYFFIGGLILLVIFYFYEKGNGQPIMPMSLFHNKVRFGAYLVRFLLMTAMLPYWFLLPQSLQRGYGFSALQSGFAFLPMTIVAFIAALQLPRLSKRFGNNTVLLVGEAILLIGLIWSSFTPLSQGYLTAVALPMILLGIGQAMVMAPVTTAGLYQAPDEIAGAASGLTNAMHQIGGPVGLSFILSLTSDFQTSLSIMAVFTALALVLVYFLIYQKGANK